MLNRRLLRVKAMQNVYAFLQGRESEKFLVIDEIQEQFKDELLKEGIMEKVRLEREEKEVIAFFENNFEEDYPDYSSISDKFPRIIASKAHLAHKQKVSALLAATEVRMLNEVEQVGKNYLRFLHTLVLISQHAEDTFQRKNKRVMSDMAERKVNELFRENPIIVRLRDSKNLIMRLEQKKVKADIEVARNWYKVLVQKADEIGKQHPDDHTKEDEALSEFEVNQRLIRAIIRNILLKEDQVYEYFSDTDMDWSENQKVVKSMLQKTIKDMEEDEEDFELLTLSTNWEDDRDFFIKLFKQSLKNEKPNSEIIAEKSKRWTEERIAKLDHIILQLAMSEMMAFPSIPVKVTINEYIEIAKQYSTPKSWQFINGMLDNISKVLQEQGKIMKSGRGLIDNR